ncbi:hypothetical protein [Enterococcus sp. DIV1420a]|uniref:hypothetical protein n=1 Tax=Enterococcus sp. DIV1420a TaxID=2774672 RepID=UPI003F206E50
MNAEKLKYIEYYNMQSTFDWLFKKSSEGRTKGINLIDALEDHQQKGSITEIDSYVVRFQQLLLQYEKLHDVYKVLVDKGYFRAF